MSQQKKKIQDKTVSQPNSTKHIVWEFNANPSLTLPKNRRNTNSFHEARIILTPKPDQDPPTHTHTQPMSYSLVKDLKAFLL